MKMKKISLYLLLATGISVAPSCKKDSVEPTSSQATVYTDEQNKENLQNTGLSMMKEMDDAKNLEGINYTKDFANLVGNVNPFGSNQLFMPINVITSLSFFGETGSTKALESSLKRGTEDLNEAYNNRLGEYIWNGNSWDKKKSDKIILRFRTPNSKNASYEITFVNYAGEGLHDDLKGYVPSNLGAKFIVDGKTLVQLEFKGVYNTDGIPSLLDAKLSVFPYSFSSTFKNNSSDISKVFAFKRNDKTLLAMGANITWNLDKATIENIINDKKAEDINKVVKSISAYTQIFDVIIKGEANVDGIVNDVKGKESVSDEEKVATGNKNLSLGVFYVSTGQKIAGSEFYIKENKYNEEYFDQNGQLIKNEYTDKDLNIRMVFKDGTKADLETYFKSGFDTLGDDFNQFAKDLGEKYSK